VLWSFMKHRNENTKPLIPSARPLSRVAPIGQARRTFEALSSPRGTTINHQSISRRDASLRVTASPGRSRGIASLMGELETPVRPPHLPLSGDTIALGQGKLRARDFEAFARLQACDDLILSPIRNLRGGAGSNERARVLYSWVTTCAISVGGEW
jgi:hypothetical protein